MGGIEITGEGLGLPLICLASSSRLSPRTISGTASIMSGMVKRSCMNLEVVPRPSDPLPRQPPSDPLPGLGGIAVHSPHGSHPLPRSRPYPGLAGLVPVGRAAGPGPAVGGVGAPAPHHPPGGSPLGGVHREDPQRLPAQGER